MQIPYKRLFNIRGMAIGIVPMLMMPSMMIFLQMSDQSYFSLATIIIMSVINEILNTFNIHLLKWGIFEIGLVTSLSRYFAIAIYKQKPVSIKDTGFFILKWCQLKGSNLPPIHYE